MDTAPSRLERNPATIQARQSMLVRNLYAPQDVYDVSSPKVSQAITAIVNTIAPGNSFDFRNSLAGRLTLPETPLAVIGSRQLAREFAARAAATAAKDNLPDFSLPGLLDGDPSTPVFTSRSDFRITPSSEPDRNPFAKVLADIRGERVLVNPVEGQVLPTQIYGLTGAGQKQALTAQLVRNTYGLWNKPAKPGSDRIGFYTDNREVTRGSGAYTYLAAVSGPEEADNTATPNNDGGEGLAGMVNTGTMQTAAYLKDTGFGVSETVGTDELRQDFPGEDNPDQNFSYQGYSDGELLAKFGADRGLLYLTNRLVRETDTVRRSVGQDIGTYVHDGKVTYRGSLPCRVFTKLPSQSAADLAVYGPDYANYGSQYATYGRLIRREGIKRYHPDAKDSVVYKSVVPKMHPVPGRDNQKYMLSIENLAYRISQREGSSEFVIGDSEGTTIPACEVGPNGGRLMWFPPYGLTISESMSSSYNEDVFIGRPEKVHTYNNSERKLSLGFTVLVDYPGQVDSTAIADLAKFFAGCEVDSSARQDAPAPPLSGSVRPVPELTGLRKPKGVVSYYFPNGSDLLPDPSDPFYEQGTRSEPYQMTNRTQTRERYTEFDSGMNKPFFADGTPGTDRMQSVGDIVGFMLEGDNMALYKLTFRGYSSKLFKEKTGSSAAEERAFNLELSKGRIFSVVKYVFEAFAAAGGNVQELESEEVVREAEGSAQASQAGEQLSNVSDVKIKKERRVEVRIEKNDALPGEGERVNLSSLARDQVAAAAGSRPRRDCAFPEQTLRPESRFPVGMEKAATFQPVFHSQTPEDLHRRLTFIQQLFRPGTPVGGQGAENVVFGRAPVCVVRIGDWIHSKVIVTGGNIEYADTTWDQNTEGIGMQPMVANVTLDLTVIGGQSLQHPIDRIQNALDFNYYANSTTLSAGVYAKARKQQSEQDAYTKARSKNG